MKKKEKKKGWFVCETVDINFKHWFKFKDSFICHKKYKYTSHYNTLSAFTVKLKQKPTGDPLHSRAACTQPCNVNTHSRAHCSPGARLCEQWGHGCVNNGARLCASDVDNLQKKNDRNTQMHSGVHMYPIVFAYPKSHWATLHYVSEWYCTLKWLYNRLNAGYRARSVHIREISVLMMSMIITRMKWNDIFSCLSANSNWPNCAVFRRMAHQFLCEIGK